MWKHLKRSERETQTSLQAQNTDSERLLSAASHVSDEKRTGGCCWLLWWLLSWNGLANKLQNVLFSKTRTNGMYSNSAARACGTRVQSPKREQILRWNPYSSFAHFYYFFKGVWQCDTCDRHLPKFVMRYIWEISACCCQQTGALRSSWFLPISAKIKAPSTFRNVSIVILLLFCKIK